MKKLGKLSINPEKVLCNEDLRLLRGGGMILVDFLPLVVPLFVISI